VVGRHHRSHGAGSRRNRRDNILDAALESTAMDNECVFKIELTALALREG